MALYSNTVMDHFRNPRNLGALADANGIGEAGNPVCGDIMKIYLKIENGIIEGNKLSFSVAEGGLSATFTTFLAEDGSITGTAEAAGILRMKLSGHVSSSTRL